eukprot:5687061-Amphidinium_carterae.1
MHSPHVTLGSQETITIALAADVTACARLYTATSFFQSSRLGAYGRQQRARVAKHGPKLDLSTRNCR